MCTVCLSSGLFEDRLVLSLEVGYNYLSVHIN